MILYEDLGQSPGGGNIEGGGWVGGIDRNYPFSVTTK